MTRPRAMPGRLIGRVGYLLQLARVREDTNGRRAQKRCTARCMPQESRPQRPTSRVKVLLATTSTTGAPMLTGPGPVARLDVGSAFRWEADMTSFVVAQVSRLVPRSCFAHLVVGEVPAAVGIADVVAVSFDQDAVRHRLDSGVGPLCSPLRVRILDALLDGRRQRVRTVARKVGSNPQALMRSSLGPLAEQGLVALAGETVCSTGAWRPVGAHLTAVELKLSKWRDALRQADNFALSANRSWVVLDEERASGALAARESFKQLGVGLAVLGAGGRLRVVVPPRGRRSERWLRALMAERAWAVAEAEVAEIAA